jgi:hypothetical protein
MAREFFYLQSIRKSIIQFLDMFKDIYITKYDENGIALKQVEVPIKLSPKSKTLLWASQNATDRLFPVIAVNLASIAHNPNRIGNKVAKIGKVVNLSDDYKSLNEYLAPVPYDITMKMSIFTKYFSEADQILEQLLVFFNPYAFIRITIPELGSDATFQIKVMLDNCNNATTEHMDESEYRIFIYDLNFTLQTYLFQPLVPVDTILKVIANLYAEREAFSHYREEVLPISAGLPPYADVTIVTTALGFDNEGNKLSKYEIYE